MEPLGIIILMEVLNYILSSPSNNIIGSIFASYTVIYGLEVAVNYIYISLDVIGFTGLIGALCWVYNLICNVSLQQLNKQQDTFPTFEVGNYYSSATKVSGKEVVGAVQPMSPFKASNLYGSYPLNSEANLSKDLKGLMRCGPSLREANESGVGTLLTP
jgi:hypothetical protein